MGGNNRLQIEGVCEKSIMAENAMTKLYNARLE
jgi:hypothetical protein